MSFMSELHAQLEFVGIDFDDPESKWIVEQAMSAVPAGVTGDEAIDKVVSAAVELVDKVNRRRAKH